MFGRKKSKTQTQKTSNVEADREAVLSKKSSTSSKQQSKSSCCGKKSGSTKNCK